MKMLSTRAATAALHVPSCCTTSRWGRSACSPVTTRLLGASGSPIAARHYTTSQFRSFSCLQSQSQQQLHAVGGTTAPARLSSNQLPPNDKIYRLQQSAWCSSRSNKGDDDDTTTTTTSTTATDCTTSTIDSDNNNNDSVVTMTNDISPDFVIPGAEKGGRKLAIVFTCTVCDTRSAKQFTEQAYTAGVVLVRCPGCQNLHLIADRLGYFGDGDYDIAKVLAEKGDTVKAVTDDNVLEITLEDLVGAEKMEQVMQSIQEDNEEPVQAVATDDSKHEEASRDDKTPSS